MLQSCLGAVQAFKPDSQVLLNANGVRLYDGFNTGVAIEDMQVRPTALELHRA